MHTEHTIYNAPCTLYTVQKDAHNIHGAHNHRARTMNWVVGGSLDDEQGAQNVHRAHKQHTTYTLHSAQNQDNTHDIHSVESQDNVQGSRDGNSGPHPVSTTLSLHLMHPSRTFVQADRTIFQDVRCGAQLRLVSD